MVLRNLSLSVLFCLFNQSQLFQIAFNLLVKVSTFGLQVLDFLHDSMNVDRFFSSST